MKILKMLIVVMFVVGLSLLNSIASAKQKDSEVQQNEIIVLTETLPTVPAVIYHFNGKLSKRDIVALKYKLEDISGVKKATASEHRVGVSWERGFSREQVEAEVLEILSSHFKTSSVRNVHKK